MALALTHSLLPVWKMVSILKTRKLMVFFTDGIVLFPSPGVALPSYSSGQWPHAAASGRSPVVRDFPSLANCQSTIQMKFMGMLLPSGRECVSIWSVLEPSNSRLMSRLGFWPWRRNSHTINPFYQANLESQTNVARSISLPGCHLGGKQELKLLGYSTVWKRYCFGEAWYSPKEKAAVPIMSPYDEDWDNLPLTLPIIIQITVKTEKAKGEGQESGVGSS